MDKWETLTIYDFMGEKSRDVVHAHPINGITQLDKKYNTLAALNDGWEPCGYSFTFDGNQHVIVHYFKRKL